MLIKVLIFISSMLSIFVEQNLEFGKYPLAVFTLFPVSYANNIAMKFLNLNSRFCCH